MSSPRRNNKSKKGQQSFWTTVPGILTAIAALITAIGGLVAALNSAGVFAPGVTPTPSPTSTPVSTETSTFTPTAEAPPTFVSHIVFDLISLERVEFETESGILPEENISDFLQLGRVAFGELESSGLAYSVDLRIKNTGTEPILLDLDKRFFSLVDEQGQAAELVYFCCAGRGDLLSPGQERVVTLIFQALPGWAGKELSSNLVFFRVRGLLPVLRATWQIPTIAVAE